MSPFQETLKLIKQYRMPSGAEMTAGIKKWWQSDSKWFGISMAAHGLVLLAVAFVPMATQTKEKTEAPSFESTQVDTTTQEADFTQFEIGEAPIDPTELSTESLTIMEAPAVEAQTEQYNDDSAVFEARGGGNANTDATGVGDLGGFSIAAVGVGPAATGGVAGQGRGEGVAFGAGGGGGSGFGGRGKGSREAMLGSGGGTKQTEKSVQGALIWFARHQNPDGSWSIHNQVCRDGNCTCGGEGDVKSNSAATAFALLPFLAAGQTHETDGPFKATISRGLNWMVANQDKNNGCLAAKGDQQMMYTHGLAAIVMAEAYGLSQDKRLLLPTQGAIRFIEAAQSKTTGSWVYGPDPNAKTGDTSVFGWQLMALKSAQMAGLQVNPATMQGAKKWLKDASKGKSGGLFCYNVEAGPSPTMTAVGVLGTQYLGAERNDPRIVEGMNYFMTLLPNPKSRNCYYWYYATQVMHNLPGPEWDRWNREMRRVLVESQVKDGCAMGSWDPNLPTPDPWGKHGGRIMVTSIAALTLEVYYRYLPLYKLDPESTAGTKKTAMAN